MSNNDDQIEHGDDGREFWKNKDNLWAGEERDNGSWLAQIN